MHRFLFIVFIISCYIPLNSQDAEKDNQINSYIETLIRNDSNQIQLKIALANQFVSKDTLCALEALENTIHTFYQIETSTKAYQLEGCENWSKILEIYSIGLKKSFSNKDLYYKLAEDGIRYAKENGANKAWFDYIVYFGSMGMLDRDIAVYNQTLLFFDEYPFGKDSVRFARKYLYLAEKDKILDVKKVEPSFREMVRILSNHELMQSDSALMATTLRAYSQFLITEGRLTDAAKKLLLAKEYLPVNSIYGLPNVEATTELCNIYLDLQNIDMAEKYNNEAIALCEKYNYSKYKDTRCIIGKAAILKAKGDLQKAISLLEESYPKYSTHSINNIHRKITGLELADLYLDVNDVTAYKKWQLVYDTIEAETDYTKILSKKTKAKYFLIIGENRKAIQLGLENLEFVVENNRISQLPSAYYFLYNAYKVSNNNQLALNYLEKYNTTNDTLYRSGQELAVSELESKYELDLKEEQIISLNVKNENSELKFTNQRKLTMISGVGLLVFSLLSFFLFKLYKKGKEQNRIIMKANEEKNILLKEIHHRVKNNLQVISSLLKLQSRFIKDENAVKAIAEGRSRVQSMALLHQNLYSDDNLKGVNIKEYFSNLIQGLFDAYNIEEEMITLKTDIEALVLDVDTVIPIGLITNELISNALKHAFVEGKQGELFVSLNMVDHKLILVVKDNGVGKKPKMEGEKDGFGKMLIESLSNKLEAEIIEIQDNGTTVQIVIHDFKIAA